MSLVSHDNGKHNAERRSDQAIEACEEFLKWLFGDDWQDVSLTAAVTGGCGWFGGAWDETRAKIESNPDQDLYYSIGCFPPGNVTPRHKTRVQSVAGLVLDDVGTKGAGDLLDELNSWDAVGAKIETSEGNFHWVMKYQQRLKSERELALHVLSVNALAELGVADRLSDVTRYMRLPAGVNSKPGRGGFRVRVTSFQPDFRCSQRVLVAEICERLGNAGLAGEIDHVGNQACMLNGVDGWPQDLFDRVADFLKQETSTSGAELAGNGTGQANVSGGSYGLFADLSDPDPWLTLQIKLAEKLGWPAPEDGSGFGTVDCRCPFANEHSSDELIRYLGNGHWKCHHSSCTGAGRTVGDYKSKLLELWDEVKEPDDPSGRLVVTQRTFERAGAASGLPSIVGGAIAENDNHLELNKALADLSNLVVSGINKDDEPGQGNAPGGLLDRYVLVSQGQRGQPGWWDTRGQVLLSGSQLEAQKDVLEVYPAGKTGQKAARHQMANTEGIRVVSALGHEPGVSGEYVCPQTGLTKISMWSGPSVEPLAETPEMFLEHMDWLVGLQGTPQRDELENFMAWMVQNPKEKAARTVVMVGAQGVGKDLLVDMMGVCLGAQNVAHISAKDLIGDYNAWRQARLVCLPEVDAGARYSVVNALKSLSGSGGGWVTINDKFKPIYRARDVAHYWMTTNELSSLPIDLDGRRDLVVQCPDQAHPDGEAYYNRVFPSLTGQAGVSGSGADPDEARRVLWYLREKIDLSGYNPSKPAPMTAAKKAMSRASHSDSVQELIEALEELGFSEEGLSGVVNPAEALVGSRAVASALEVRARIKNPQGKARAFSRAMEALGWVQIGSQVRDTDGRVNRVWVLKTNRMTPLLHPQHAQERQAAMAHSAAILVGKPQNLSLIK